MVTVDFYELGTIDDSLLDYAVIVSKYKNQWVFCKQKGRDTWEIPGGKRELNEEILDAAKRELWEETGATSYTLKPIYIYSMQKTSSAGISVKSYGLVFSCIIEKFSDLPESEMEKIEFFSEIPKKLTHPEAHPLLIKKAESLQNIEFNAVK